MLIARSVSQRKISPVRAPSASGLDSPPDSPPHRQSVGCAPAAILFPRTGFAASSLGYALPSHFLDQAILMHPVHSLHATFGIK